MRRCLVGLGLLGALYACSGEGSVSPKSDELAGAGGDAELGQPGSGGAPGTAGTRASGGGGEMPNAGATMETPGGSPGQTRGGAPSDSPGGAPSDSPGGAASGAPGGASNGGSGGDGTVPSNANPILLASTHFLDYGVLRVAFTHPVKAASLSVTLTPVLEVAEIKAVDDNTVDVLLRSYHLPRDYDLSISGALNDSQPFTSEITLPGLGNGARVAFITKQAGKGNLKGWENVPAGATTPRAAADAVCQAEASGAGFEGKFVAFLSAQGQYDAGCRALGLDGTLANKCGQALLPEDHAPWLGPNGLPIVEGASNVVTGSWQNAFSYYADGTRATQVGVWTGTSAGAKASGSDCTGWTTISSALAETTEFIGEYLPRYDEFGGPCDSDHRLLCLQVGGDFFGPSALHQVGGKRAFVSQAKLTGAMSYGGKSGRAAADALCQAEAGGASYENASSFHAYLSTSSDDAVCHILGLTGKISNKCGLAALPTQGGWRRADNYPVGTAAQLASASLTAPIAFAADGSPQFEQHPWTGSLASGDVGSTCLSWSSADAGSTGATGLARALTNGFTRFMDSSCNLSQPVYCFEQ